MNIGFYGAAFEAAIRQVAREVAREEVASLVGYLLEELEGVETAELRSSLARLLPMYGREGDTRPGP